MSVLDRPPTDLSSREAERLARELFGVQATARALPSERDQNFRLEVGSGEGYVLKIANPAEDRGVLDLQNRALVHLADQEPPILAPRLRRTLAGEEIASTTVRAGSPVLVRMLTYVPGRFLSDVHPHGGPLLHSLGRLLGRIDTALQGLSHPAAQREWEWDIANTRFLLEHKAHIDSSEDRSIVEHCLREFDRRVSPRAGELRRGLIHNDGNDHNVIVQRTEAGGEEAVGIIDFGDMVQTFVVCELAIGIAYPILAASDPVGAACHVVRGFHEVLPLRAEEIDVLYDLMCVRLCATVTMAAYRKKLFHDNAYIMVTEGPAWDFLRTRARRDPESFRAAFRSVCRSMRDGEAT